VPIRPDDAPPPHIDYRFSLANERTFLAWNRTALALVAGGLAVVQLLDEVEPEGLRRALGVPMVLLGGLIAALSFSRWERNERAMNEDRSLPRSILPRLLAVGVTAGALIAIVLVLVADVG
jgi:putative membrane protein